MESGYMRCHHCYNVFMCGERKLSKFENCLKCNGTNVTIGLYGNGFAPYPVDSTKIEALPFFKNWEFKDSLINDK